MRRSHGAALRAETDRRMLPTGPDEPGEEQAARRPASDGPAAHELRRSRPEDRRRGRASTRTSLEDETAAATVLITGASGNIGRKLRTAWADVYDLVLIDRTADPDDPEVIVADLASSTTSGSPTSTASTRSSTWRPTRTSSPPGRSWSGPTSTPWPTSSTPRRWPASNGSSSPARTT